MKFINMNGEFIVPNQKTNVQYSINETFCYAKGEI